MKDPEQPKRKERKKMTKKEILAVSLRQSAIDFSCSEEDFLRNVNVVSESKPAEGASRYMKLPHICGLASYGTNVVASCRADLIPEVEQYLGGIGKMYHCFDAPGIYDLNRILQKANARIGWMHSFFLPDPEAIYAAERPCPYETRELHPEDFTELYLPEFHFRLNTPVIVIILQLLLRLRRRPLRTDIDHPFRTEDFHAQHIFQRTFIQQFHQCSGFHRHASFPVSSAVITAQAGANPLLRALLRDGTFAQAAA